MKDKIEFEKLIDKKNIHIFLFNLRHLIHIPGFRIVNLLSCGGHVSNTTFIGSKTKYRSPYISWMFPDLTYRTI